MMVVFFFTDSIGLIIDSAPLPVTIIEQLSLMVRYLLIIYKINRVIAETADNTVTIFQTHYNCINLEFLDFVIVVIVSVVVFFFDFFRLLFRI